ncbi:hypothetical protein [Paenibacillus agilis]|uniref:hypothetical protein n=1 Tax=Paenibacillus agilis TaxID=3020863 RepID=UPI001649833E|nr:hypothetical protein [Paenibacillus agilis]
MEHECFKGGPFSTALISSILFRLIQMKQMVLSNTYRLHFHEMKQSDGPIFT